MVRATRGNGQKGSRIKPPSKAIHKTATAYITTLAKNKEAKAARR